MNPDVSPARWFYIPAVWLIVFASWWTSATGALRIGILWIIGLIVLGRWGRRRLGDGHRAFLAALLGLGMVHIVLFPAAGQSVLSLAAKSAFLMIVFVELIFRLPGWSQREPEAARPLPITDRRYLAAACLVSLAVGAYFVSHRPSSRSGVAATGLWIAAPLAYYLVFSALVRDYRPPARREWVAGALFTAPVVIVLIAAMQLALLGFTAWRAGQPEKVENYDEALRWNHRALTINRWVQSRAMEDRLLVQRARCLAWEGRNVESLDVLLRFCRNHYFPPDEPLLRSLCEAYLSTGTLEEQIVALSHPRYLWRFDELPSPEEPELRSLLLGSFVRNGLLDRLLIEYARGRLTESLDTARLRSSLLALRSAGSRPDEVWIDYLLGILTARLRGYEKARQFFQRVLKRWPTYHNALVWLDRLDATEKPQGGNRDSRPATGRIENAQMLGNHRYGLNVDDALWTAFEARPGRYELALSVRGLPAEKEWPILSVYVDGTLVFEEPVRSETWTTMTCRVQFDNDACHRLVIGFQNDLYKEVGGRLLNRNLYFRYLSVRRAKP